MEHCYSSIKRNELLIHLNMDESLNKRSQTPPHIVDKIPYLQDSRKCYGPSSLVAQSVKESACNAGDVRDEGSIPGLGRSPGRKWQPTPVFLPGESHGQRCLVGYSPWGHKESDTAEQLSTHTE